MKICVNGEIINASKEAERISHDLRMQLSNKKSIHTDQTMINQQVRDMQQAFVKNI